MEYFLLIVIAVANLLGFFLLFKVKPSLKGISTVNLPSVSVIIPARNEAKRIQPLLESLKREGAFKQHEVIVVDDHSVDQTASIAESFGAKVITSKPLPKQWFGKPWACYQGAQAATKNIYMFLDADTAIEKQGFKKLLGVFFKEKTPMSVQPYHTMKKPYESLALLFNLIVMMSSGLFTPLGKRFKASTFFGPCQVVTKDDYWAIDGHGAAKHVVLEDIALGQAFQKTLKTNVRAYAGNGIIAFRMYPEGLASLIEGFIKNFATGAGMIAPWLLVVISIWITGIFMSFLSLSPETLGNGTYAIGYLVTGLITWLLSRKIGQFPLLVVLFYPLYVLFFLWIFVRSSMQANKKKVMWKGRSLDL
jgi:4,4'-diaponeurosporenoate glycosyltransferase